MHRHHRERPRYKKKESFVNLQIQNTLRSFSVNELRCLSWFERMYQPKWLENDTKNTQRIFVIQVFAPNAPATFGFIHIEWLLKCIDKKRIPSNLQPQRQLLEGLINCDKTLMDNRESVITVSNLIDYFDHVIPRLTIEQKQQLLRNTNNKTLTRALTQHNMKHSHRLDEMRLNMANNQSRIRSINNIKYDSKTAIALLSAKFKFRMVRDKNINLRELRIIQVNFTNKKEYENLANQCTAKDLANLSRLWEVVGEITRNENTNLKIEMQSEHRDALRYVLKHTCNIISAADGNLTKSGFDVQMLACCKTLLRLAVDFSMSICVDEFRPLLEKLSIEKMRRFCKVVFDVDEKYYQLFCERRDRDWNDERKEEMENARQNLSQFWKLCLCRCGRKWCVDNARMWFRTVNKYDKQSAKWIVKDILDKINHKDAQDFGFYLTDYINYHRDVNTKFPQEYLNFLETSLGINWSIA